MSAKNCSKKKLWNDESMSGAIKNVEIGTSLRAASRMYNVPVESLRRRVIGNVDVTCRPGPPSVLIKQRRRCYSYLCY